MQDEPTAAPAPVYRFGPFVLRPTKRELTRAGEPVDLIPRYFDLLTFLVEHRGQAVSREAIFDVVWHDVMVSDGALTQAIRTLRRCLGDQPKKPRYIRTLARRGYLFIADEVDEIDDATEAPDEPRPGVDRTFEPVAPATDEVAISPSEQLEHAIARLVSHGASGEQPDEDSLRDAALTIHYLGRRDALERAGGARDAARAILRDARWELPETGPVPLWGAGILRSSWHLIRLRLRGLREVVVGRWLGGTSGGALAGIVGGLGGAALLRYGPGSVATNSILLALPLFGSLVGALGAAGVGAGLCLAEATVRSARGFALAIGGAIGGGLIGGLAHLVGRFTIDGLFGRDLSPVAGSFEGAVLGLAAGVGYALATPSPDGGLAAPRSHRRLGVALAAAASTAAAASALGYSGSYLGAMSLDLMSQSFPGSQVSLNPLARLLGEAVPGPATRTLISAWEGALFGFGLVWGLTRRPKRRLGRDES